MARRTDGEKIDELEKLTAQLAEQVKYLNKTLDTVDAAQEETIRALYDLRPDHEREVAVLKREIDELRRWTQAHGTADLKAEVGVLRERTTRVEATQEKAAGRAWAIVPNVVGAVISGLIAAAVAYFVARR